jgi:hypothetical protein
MASTLANVLIALLLSTSSLAPLCEIDCRLGRDALPSAGSPQGSVQRYCHATPEPTDQGKHVPLREHPCDGGLHHRTALSTSDLTRSVVASFLIAVSPGGIEVPRAIPALVPSERTLPGDFAFLPFATVDPLPLRI